MARTTFSGPVKSDNGFEGNLVSGTISSASATVTNMVVTSLVIGTTTITTGAVSGTIADQAGYIPVSIGGTTKYIALYDSLTP